MKKSIIALIFLVSSLSVMAQHDVYMNFFEFLGKVNTVGYRYHLTEYTSIGGDVSFSNQSNFRLVSTAKKRSFLQTSAEYLVFFNPKESCDRFYVGPNLAYRESYDTFEFVQGTEVYSYRNTYTNLFFSLTSGRMWRHKSGFFFSASGTVGRSLYSNFTTTNTSVFQVAQSKNTDLIFRFGLNVGWKFGQKDVAK